MWAAERLAGKPSDFMEAKGSILLLAHQGGEQAVLDEVNACLNLV